MTPADLQASNVPKAAWELELGSLSTAADLPHADSLEFFKWMRRPFPLLTILGPEMSGKTTLAGAIARYWVDKGTQIQEVPDATSAMLWTEFRLYFASAPIIMPAYHHSLTFQDEANYDNILQKTRLLVLDDIDETDSKYVPEIMALIRGRLDNDLTTVVTLKSKESISELGTGFTARVQQGRVVKLNARG